jgi:putative ABC transport system permease protein
MLPVPLLGVGRDFTRKTPAGFPAEQFLTATLAMDPFDGVAATTDTVSAVPGARLEERYRQLADRLRQEPGVLGVTYADQMPVMRHQWGGIWMDPGPAAAHSERCVGGYCGAYVSVDPQFFEAIGVPVLRGRALTAADAEHRTRAVLVNEFFVEQVMGGRNPLGRRLRSSSTPEPTAESWYEIVGVVPDLGVTDNTSDFGRARVFRAALPREMAPLRLAVHVRGDPQAFAPRLRELAHAVDPALRVIDPQPLPRLAQSVSRYWISLLIAFTVVTVTLSLAGVHAVTAS